MGVINSMHNNMTNASIQFWPIVNDTRRYVWVDEAIQVVSQIAMRYEAGRFAKVVKGKYDGRSISLNEEKLNPHASVSQNAENARSTSIIEGCEKVAFPVGEGRAGAFLMSLPPTVRFEYNDQPEKDSEEEKLTRVLLSPREWV